jgi:exodeoxyribonuclease V alpha subunit
MTTGRTEPVVLPGASAGGEMEDPYAGRLATGATGPLGDLNEAGVLDAADVHVATRLAALAGETDERVLLAAALAVRGVRNGWVSIELEAIHVIAPDSDWP